MELMHVEFVCLSVRMIRLENFWTDFDEIWYELYIVGVYCKMVVAHWMGQSSLGGNESQRATEVRCPVGPLLCDMA